MTNDPEEILELQKEYYRTLYSKRHVDRKSASFFTDNLRKISEHQKMTLSAIITVEEIGKALAALPNDKSPGSSGFTTDFYKFFWADLKDIVFESLKYALN